jgi:hypothetical protein
MSQQPSPNDQNQLVNDSLNGVAKFVMPTSNGSTHSINGIARLKPQAPTEQTPQNTSQPSANTGNSGTAERESTSTNNS